MLGARVIIKSLVVFTSELRKDMLRELSSPGVKVTSAAVEELDVSFPIVPMKGAVVYATPGLVIPVIITARSATRDVEVNALLIVIVKLDTVQVKPEMLTPLMLTSRHVAVAMRELVNCGGKAMVAVAEGSTGEEDQGV